MPDSFKWRMVWALMEEAQPQWKGIWKRLRCAATAARKAVDAALAALVAGGRRVQSPFPLTLRLSPCPPCRPLRRRYDYVMVADDDLVMDACAIDTLFDVSAARLPRSLPALSSQLPAWRGGRAPDLSNAASCTKPRTIVQ